jgi:hypothetical protein
MASPARPSDPIAVIGALAVMHVGTPAHIRAYLAARGVTLGPRWRVSQALTRLAAHDPPLAEIVIRDITSGNPGVWRLTDAGRKSRATYRGRLATHGGAVAVIASRTDP